ncbi:MAG TPA: CPBP family intramembrane glutamic endopeptidase [Acidimicrobiia bacterium]
MLLILAAHNVVQNSILNEHGYVPGNVVVAATLAGLARDAGLTWEEIGLGRGDLRMSRRTGAWILTASTAFLAVTARIPRIRHHLRDERAPIGSRRETIRRALIRFPVGTALFEEVAFRGVLPALLASATRSGDITAAGMFAIWHLIPTHHALRVNGIAQGPRSRILGTLAGSAAAGLAGYVLSRVRRKTGSILAPWLIHSAVNTTSFLAAVRAGLDDT